ncbi:HNH endonuclease signature motif containing protein [Leekyejoonella antrihumi]|nr:HNH endonuclease signature motif containing protein [Leekyejoonella antrihumi]
MKEAAGDPVTESDTAPEWLAAATALLDRDPGTGLVDTDRLLEVMSWLGQAAFSHAKTDRSHHDRAGLLDQIQAAQALINTASAIQHVRVAQYVATTETLDLHLGTDPGEDAGGPRECAHELGQVGEFADVDLAPVMCWGPMQATRRIEEAVDAVTKTPRLLDEMGAGRLDATRVAQVTWELAEAGDVTCAQVEDLLLGRGLCSWTSRQARNRARTLVRRCDPPAAKTARAKRTKEEIGVFTRPGPENGLTEWTAILPTKDALPAFQAVDELARQLHQDSMAGKTLGECRADALCDLILGHADVQTIVNVLVPIKAGANTSTGAPSGDEPTSPVEQVLSDVLADYNWDAALRDLIIDLDHHPDDDGDGSSDVAGTSSSGGACSSGASPPADEHHPPEPDPPEPDPPEPDPPEPDPAEPDPPKEGPPDQPPPPPGVHRPLCLPDVEIPGIGVIPAEAVQEMICTLGTTVTRALVDWHTGTILETGATTYRPTAAIRRHVMLRDQHCRFPGCERPAKFCDVDHVTPWPQGPTKVSNLQCLCRHHHRAKHETRWQVTMTPDGTSTWTSPSGREYTTYPGTLDVTADLHVTAGAPVESDSHDADGAGQHPAPTD